MLNCNLGLVDSMTDWYVKTSNIQMLYLSTTIILGKQLKLDDNFDYSSVELSFLVNKCVKQKLYVPNYIKSNVKEIENVYKEWKQTCIYRMDIKHNLDIEKWGKVLKEWVLKIN